MSDAVRFLRARGAADLDHPGGTLLTHLQRVHDRLGRWGARPALRLAGLCHACYGTDGFAASLLSLQHRAELVGVIGEEAEAIVRHYAGCDRRASYPALAEDGGEFYDRFSGRSFIPGPRQRRDFAELTAANELDLADADPEFRQRAGADLLELFTRWRPLLSEPAWADCRTTLGRAGLGGEAA